MVRFRWAVALLLVGVPATAQEVSLESRVKATYLYNFVKYVEWPASVHTGSLTICVAGHNPFGTVLEDTIRGEVVNGRKLTTRVILEPEPGCDVLFIPDGSAAAAYLRAVRGTPTLTVGETNDFLARGGMINFVSDDRHVRFALNAEAVEQAQLHVSSRLLQLAINTRGGR